MEARAVRAKDIAAAWEVFVAGAACLRGNSDIDLVVVGILAELDMALAMPPVIAGLPVARGLLAVQAGRGGLKDDTRTLRGVGGEHLRVFDVGADGKATGSFWMGKDGGCRAGRKPGDFIGDDRLFPIVIKKLAVAGHNLRNERLAIRVGFDDSGNRGDGCAAGHGDEA